MKPTLLILAAGIGSRYGSLKQIDQLGPSGERIIDYSVFDAKRTGFEKIVFVIRKDIEKEFNEVFIEKLARFIDIDYVFQELDNLPDGLSCPADRIKPWGTGHAVLVAEEKIRGPFTVINADDFYGHEAFHVVSHFFDRPKDSDDTEYCMVGYKLKNTLSEHGFVSRGVCEKNRDNLLVKVTERTQIGKIDDNIYYKDAGNKLVHLSPEDIVSMNFWGFYPSVFQYIRQLFTEFIRENIRNPKAEFYIPLVVDRMIREKKCTVKVLDCESKWFGVTYREDKPEAIARLGEFTRKNIYPSPLWT